MNRSSSHRSHRPIFVVGYMHSGTSLLRNILRNHDHIYTGRGETRFFVNLPIIANQFPDLSDPATHRAYVIYLAKIINTSYGKVHFEKVDDETPLDYFGLTAAQLAAVLADVRHLTDHRLLFAHVYDRLTAVHGRQRWLEKTPTHLFHVEEIIDVVPDAQFVEVVRDPRDILASKYRRFQGGAPTRANPNRQHIAGLQVGYDPLWDTLAWKSAVRLSNRLHAALPGQIVRVRYEDLVTHPAREMQRVCDFLDLSFDESMLMVPWQNTTDRSKWQTRGISAAAVGRWQSTLPPAAVGLCQRLARPEMRQLGYEPARVTAVSALKLPVIFSKSGVELAQRFYRRWRLGGATYARNVLANYWIRFVNVIKG